MSQFPNNKTQGEGSTAARMLCSSCFQHLMVPFCTVTQLQEVAWLVAIMFCKTKECEAS